MMMIMFCHDASANDVVRHVVARAHCRHYTLALIALKCICGLNRFYWSSDTNQFNWFVATQRIRVPADARFWLSNKIFICVQCKAVTINDNAWPDKWLIHCIASKRLWPYRHVGSLASLFFCSSTIPMCTVSVLIHLHDCLRHQKLTNDMQIKREQPKREKK